MASPSSNRHLPLGVQQLMSLSRVLVREKTNFMAGNKYVVTSPEGAVLLYANEDYGGSFLSARTRAFNIDVYDSQQTEVMKLRRPYTFGPDKMDVRMGGRLVSVVREQHAFFKKVLSINDADDQPVLRVKGSAFTSGECDFDLFTPNKQQVGVIRKCWGGAGREFFTSSDNFDIQFPQELHVKYKAAIIGTCFLIDFLYYEN